MKSEKPLSSYYRSYFNGDIQRYEFEGIIFRYLLENYKRYKLFNNDRNRWGEFLSWLYGRLNRAIDTYRDLGSSFDSYITSLLHGASKEFRSREADQYLTEYVCWQARAEEMTLFESEPEYNGGGNVKPAPADGPLDIPEDIIPRQLLFLLLKSYYFATEEMVCQVAKLNRMKCETVREMIDEIRNLRSSRDTEIRELKDRLYLQHYRCLAYQSKLKSSEPGSDYSVMMEGRLNRAKKRYHTMKKRLESMRKAASNKMVAQVLGIPQGTVDSGLHTVKGRLRVFLEQGY